MDHQSTKYSQDDKDANTLGRAVEAIVLVQVADRLKAVEQQLIKVTDASNKNSSVALELAKLAFGGWPVLGMVFLLLFYVPVRDALQAIPDKVRSAEEIGLPGVSLKSTIKAEAARSGIESLADALPSLSAPAIELLLQSQRNYGQSLTSMRLGSGGTIPSVTLPDEQYLKVLAELEDKGLVRLRTFFRKSGNEGVTAAKDLMLQFKKAYPGKEALDPSDRNSRTWQLDKPLERGKEPELQMHWETTDLGRRAVEVIVRSVSTALAPKYGIPSKPESK